MESESQLIRIGVFYDGQYFFNVSNFYNYQHQRKARISISGLHEFIRNKVAAKTGVGVNFCQIVDAHYFKCRLKARESDSRNKLLSERLFEDILMLENVVSHYLPLRYDKYDKLQEKGIDVWFALEAYEMAVYKRFDVVVLVACDGDYVPLVRKLHTLGAKVMLVSWDFRYTDENGNTRETRTSQQLLEAVSYPVEMHSLIDSRVGSCDLVIQNLFVSNGRSPNTNGSVATDTGVAGTGATSATETIKAIEASPTQVDSADAAASVPAENVTDEPQSGKLSEKLSDKLSDKLTTDLDPPIESSSDLDSEAEVDPNVEVRFSTILRLQNGYGFIKDNSVNNVFFYHESLEDIDFNNLKPGMRVKYLRKINEGRYIATRVWLVT